MVGLLNLLSWCLIVMDFMIQFVGILMNRVIGSSLFVVMFPKRIRAKNKGFWGAALKTTWN